jgi:hypothetical protein
VLNFVHLSGQEHNFDKLTGLTDDKSHGYDYASIMHYGPKAFSVNGKNTITAKNGASIGQSERLSAIDVEQAKTMYPACGSTGGTGIVRCILDIRGRLFESRITLSTG